MRKIINEEFGLRSGDIIMIKAGSDILVGNDNGVNLENIKNIVNGISYAMEIGLKVLYASSGAVAVGKSIMKEQGITYGDELSIYEESYLSTIGQAQLINTYLECFRQKNIIISMGLLTHRNISGDYYKNVLKQNFKMGTLAILNENNFVSGEELERFSDNDELAGMTAIKMKAIINIILSNIEGVYKNFGTNNQELIENVYDIGSIRKHSIKVEGGVGKGQMDSKLNITEKLQKNKIYTVIAHGGIKDIIQKIINGEKCKKTIFRV